MTTARLERWERRLRRVLARVDAALEEAYGGLFHRRPNRPPAGSTSDPRYDGVFDVDAVFSLGIGLEGGPGYTVDLRVASFDRAPPETEERILQDVERMLEEELRREFPKSDLRVVRSGRTLRVVGDLGFND